MIILIIITLFPSFKYFISTWEIIQFKKRILTALKSYFKVHHGGKKSKRRQRTLLLFPININVKKISKKASKHWLDQACIIIIIIIVKNQTLDQGMQKPKSSNINRKIHRKERTHRSYVCRI